MVIFHLMAVMSTDVGCYGSCRLFYFLLVCILLTALCYTNPLISSTEGCSHYTNRDLFTKSFGKSSKKKRKKKKKKESLCMLAGKLKTFWGGKISVPPNNGLLLGDDIQHYAKQSSVNERSHKAEVCNPSVMATQ